MAKRTVYLKDSDEDMIAKLRELFPDATVSEIVRKGLKAKLAQLSDGENLTTEQKIDFIVKNRESATKGELEAKGEEYINGMFEVVKEFNSIEGEI